MSIVTVQLGQCGNQLGTSFFQTLADELSTAPPSLANSITNTFFYGDGGTPTARAVLIDMEPKVVNTSLEDARRSGSWLYDSEATFCQQEGSGNNWAFGYAVHGLKWRDEMVHKVLRQLERCDRLAGIQLFQSLAGGTGSGVGTRMTEELRDEVGSVPILNTVVWPHSFGEVIVQNFNIALSLSHLVEVSDGLIILQNDKLQSTARHLLDISQPDFSHVNSVATSILTSVFCPVVKANLPATYSQFCQSPFNEIVEQLCLSPGHKLMTAFSVPHVPERSLSFSNDSWNGLVKRAYQMMLTDTFEPSINWSITPQSPARVKTLGALAVLRGKQVSQADTSAFSDISQYTSWSLTPYKELRTDQSLIYEKRVSVVANSQACLLNLDTLIDRTARIVASGAYMHQYTKYGIERDDFSQYVLPVLEQVLYNYSHL
jgi:tubulin delta